MANFCTYCGKPIPEGGSCDCPASRAAAQQAVAQQPRQPQQPQQPYAGGPNPVYPNQQPAQPNPTAEKLKGVFGRLIPFLRSYLKDPLSATSAALRQHDLGVSVVVMIVYALLCGFCQVVLFNRLLDKVFSDSIAAPFFLIMVLMIVAAAIVLALRTLALFAILKIQKVNAPIMDALIATGVSALIPACMLLLGLLGALISLYVFAVLAALSLLFQIILFTHVVTRVFGVRPQGMYSFACAAVLCVSMLIAGWLNSMLICKCGNSCYYKEETSQKCEIFDSDGEVSDICALVVYFAEAAES